MNRIEIRPEINEKENRSTMETITRQLFCEKSVKWVTSRNTNKKRKKAKDRENKSFMTWMRDNTEYFTFIKRIIKGHFVDFDLHLIKEIINLKLFKN